MVYLRPYKETNLSLPDVNYKSLRRLPNLLIDPTTLDKWDKVPPLTNLTTDYLYEGAQAWYPHYSCIAMVAISSTRVKLCKTRQTNLPSMSPRSRRGVILPQINTVSIFEGKRTDNNGGGNRLDIKTLHQVEFRPPWDPDLLGLILRDANFLYINGHRLAIPIVSVCWHKSHGISEESFLPRLIPVWLCHLAPGIPWLVHGPKS